VATTALDLHAPDVVADPYPIFARLRERTPVLRHEPTGLWLTFRYEHAKAILRDRRFGRLWTDRQPVARWEAFNLLHRNQMMENEPPDHTRLRSLVAKAFARGHVERLRPRIAEVCAALLDRVASAGEMDLLADYAEPLPVAVIAELLGVPESDRSLLRPWSNAIVKMYEYGPTGALEERALAASREFADYMRGLVRERRRRPAEDLVSHLAAVEDGGRRLSEDEAVASAILLLNAGHEASVNVLGNGITALLRHPGQVARLRASPELVGPAIEEMIRYDSPLQLFERTAREDVLVGDQLVRAGEKAAALLGAANRDPAAFADPDRFDVGRSPNPHLGFGAGLHFCLGAPLARVELQTALAALLRRLPGMELAAEPERRPTFVLRGYREVRVAFSSP
jgi:cytochrome P450